MTPAFTSLSPAHQAFVSKYMNGNCDALAIALSAYFDYTIVAMRPIHIDASGERRTDPDFLHVYVIDQDGMALDARGKRSQDEVRAEFEPFLQVLRRPEDVAMDVELFTFENGFELVTQGGCDPKRSAQALTDAIAPLGLCPLMAASTREILEDETSFDPDAQCDSRLGLFF